jgi:mono/diheme cytochrome c family protein
MGKILLGVVLGVILVPVAVAAWLYLGKPPVAAGDPPFPMERQVTQVLLNARIDRELVKTPPVQVTEENLVAGAQVYRDQCAACHGFNGKPSTFGPHMFPSAPPLWEKHAHNNLVGVSDDPPGETYWKVANGIRLTGMPGYKDVLTETQMWQVSVLLANADKPLPPAALAILHGESHVVAPASGPGPVAAPAAQK